MLEKIARDDFASQVNTVFFLPTNPLVGATGPSGGLALELCQVSELRVYRNQEVFSLTFKGPRDRLLQQQIYHLEHEQLGPLDIFLVPVQSDGSAIYYEAVFNRLVQQDR